MSGKGKGKRGQGEGSIYKHSNGKWRGVVSLGWENGKRKRKYIQGETRREVQQQVAAILRQQEQGLPIAEERQTVAQYLAAWLLTTKTTVRLSTWTRYEELCRLHLIPALGTVPLAKLTPQALNRLYATKLDAGLSARTVRYLHTTLHKALSDALKLGLVPRNVCELATPPRKPRREMRVWTPEQVQTFRATIAGDPLEALYVLALSTGMRQGELLALRWRDVDLAGYPPRLQVQSSVRRMRGVFVFSEPKTSSGRRNIRLAEEALTVLRSHRVRQVEQRLRAGAAWHDHDLVFPDAATGAPMTGPYLQRSRFNPLVCAASVPVIRFHDLRHTAATLLLLAGVPTKAVSEMLGHSSVAITLDLYAHVLPEMQERAASVMDRLLGGGTGGTVAGGATGGGTSGGTWK